MTTLSFDVWATDMRARLEKTAEECLPPTDELPSLLHEAMRYAVLGAGKRVRPLLVYAGGEVTEASLKNLDFAAFAVECVHSYSLIHDDLPCMDNDLLRHGKPSTHAKYGEAMAMLAGDALQPEAFLALGRLDISPVQKCRVFEVLAYASSTRGMCGGQAIDLVSVGKTLSYEDLKEMHLRKTGALLEASILMGAYVGRPDFLTDGILEDLSSFGKKMGLAFQVVDDILDVTADSATLGKTAGKDLKDDKPTYVSALGLDKAKELARQLHDQALSDLDSLAQKYGLKTGRLKEIADYIIRRSY